MIAKYQRSLQAQFSVLTKDDWTQNMYWTWLYTLQTLFGSYGSGYPSFMTNAAWNDKDLQTALGSWTELRHDTLLYGKQSYAEMGGGGEPPTPPPVPKGYVEPNVTFLNRLIAMSTLTRDGLKNSGVLPRQQENKIDSMIKTFTFYRDIAVKELGNKTISDADFEHLRTSALELNYPMTPADEASAYIKSKEARAGLIADVHTAVTQAKQEILYEATGIPSILYVAVKDANGERLTRGVGYSYYEFTRPLGTRLSDENWQAVIYEQNNAFPAPTKPVWAQPLNR